MSNGRVLLVSYWFPPAGGIAVQRALSLAKYLPQNGCELHVLAPSNPPSPVPDPSLLSEVPTGVRVHRAWTPSPPAQLRKRLWGLVSNGSKGGNNTKSKWAGGLHAPDFIRRFLSPDPEVVWVPFATRRAIQVVRKYRIETVLVTAPPFSAFLVGNALKRKFAHLRLISDFRDEWLRFFLSTFDFQKNQYIRRHAEAIERSTIELSDTVVSITSPIVSELRERYPDQPQGKFVYIPNGYDPGSFVNFCPRPHATSKIVVTYVGTVYSTTSPRPYFEALDTLPESVRVRIETRFVGRIAEDQRNFLESRPDVKLLGYVTQKEALRHMEETDYLLLVMNDPSFATGKIYEYLATGKPILAFSPTGGEVERTLKETGGGWCIDPNDGEAIRALLRKVASNDLAAQFRPNQNAIRCYERPRLAEKFAQLILNDCRPAFASSV